MTAINQNLVEVGSLEKLKINYYIRHDLRETKVFLGDYIRLHELNVGDIIF